MYKKIFLILIVYNFTILPIQELTFTNKSNKKLYITLTSTKTLKKEINFILNEKQTKFFSLKCLRNKNYDIDSFQINLLGKKTTQNFKTISIPLDCNNLEYTITKKLEINERCDNFTKIIALLN